MLFLVFFSILIGDGISKCVYLANGGCFETLYLNK